MSGPAQISQIGAALRRGASAALTTIEPADWPDGAPVIRVEHVGRALGRLAGINRRRFAGRVIGVTGSVGKTSTKDILYHVLSSAGETYRSDGNTNGLLGILGSLACIPPQTAFAVMELASVRRGNLAMKCRPVRPEVGVITNVGYSHGGNYASRRSLIREKLSILNSLEGERIAVVNQATVLLDEANDRLLTRKNVGRIITAGTEAGCTIRIADVIVQRTRTLSTIEVAGRTYQFALNHPGRQFVVNAALALGVAHGLKLDLEALTPSIAAVAFPARRADRLRVDLTGKGKVVEIIDDAFNAAPESVRALLKLLQDRQPPGRKVLILGDMLELGPESHRLHEELAEDIKAAGIALLITVGPLAALAARSAAGTEVLTFSNAAELRSRIKPILKPWDLVAVKGSSAMKLGPVVQAIRATPAVVRRVGADWCIESEHGDAHSARSRGGWASRLLGASKRFGKS